MLARDGLIEPHVPQRTAEARDLTREPLVLPASRPLRLQNLARADEGFLLAHGLLDAARLRQFNHPFVGEIRIGEVEVEFVA
jgi:alpha-D-ribose 1-methylphosphonate 5-triphosphate synthase subunit PhnI